MCKDCGCVIAGQEHHHHHHDDNDHSHSHGHSHNQTNMNWSASHQAAHETLHHNPQLNDAKTISVIQKILDKNDHEAAHNRAHFDQHKVLGINLMENLELEKLH